MRILGKIKGLLKTPAGDKAHLYPGEVSLKVSGSRDISNRHALSLILPHVIVRTVISLLSAGGPSTVFFRVPFVIVYSFYRHFLRGALTHIAVKVTKILPIFGESYSSAKVTLAFLVGATFLYSKPNSYFGGIDHPVLGVEFYSKATA